MDGDIGIGIDGIPVHPEAGFGPCRRLPGADALCGAVPAGYGGPHPHRRRPDAQDRLRPRLRAPLLPHRRHGPLDRNVCQCGCVCAVRVFPGGFFAGDEALWLSGAAGLDGSAGLPPPARACRPLFLGLVTVHRGTTTAPASGRVRSDGPGAEYAGGSWRSLAGRPAPGPVLRPVPELAEGPAVNRTKDGP